MKSSCRKFLTNDVRLLKRVSSNYPTYLRVISSLLFLLIFISCEKEIAFSGKVLEPQLVVNSFITPDSLVVAQITESRFFLNNEDTFRIVEGADVQLFVDNVFKEQMNDEKYGYYKSVYAPTAGETIRLVIAKTGFKTVSCETEVKKQTEILSVDTTVTLTESMPITSYSYPNTNSDSIDTIGYSNSYILDFTLKFKDPAETADYYRLDVKRQETFEDGSVVISDAVIDFTDIVSGKKTSSGVNIFDGGNAANSYNVFSDEIFNGKEYPLKFKFKEYSYYYLPGKTTINDGSPRSIKKELIVDLQAISRDYYLYLKSRSASGNDIFFSEPVQIYNNVENGIGILGSYTNNIVKIELPL